MRWLISVLVVAILALSQVNEGISVVWQVMKIFKCHSHCSVLWQCAMAMCLSTHRQTETGKEMKQHAPFVACISYYFNKLLHSSFLGIKTFFFLIRTAALTTPKTRCTSPEKREKTREKVLQWRPLNVVIIVLTANLNETKSLIKGKHICTISHSNPNVWRIMRIPWRSRKAAPGRQMSMKKQKISATFMAKLLTNCCTWISSLFYLWFGLYQAKYK